MAESALDAALDTVKMLPFLLAIYLLIEWMEGRYGDAMVRAAKSARRSGPLVAALVGCVPQCGFSSVGSALYARRAITLGTLLAVFLSTSDEALPVLLSRPDKAGLVVPVVLTKVAVAIVIGLLVDAASRSPLAVQRSEGNTVGHPHGHEGVDHHAHCEHERRALWVRVASHTGQVAFTVFAATFLLNHAIASLGHERLAQVMLASSPLQPFLVALVGLIPNCAASVAVTQAWLEGSISFGSAMAGLCAAAGVGMIVLVRENRPVSDTLRVIALLYLVSAAVGLAIQAVAR
jgi:hypothetical protein